jgi:uncharacterized membrane-anchored protein
MKGDLPRSSALRDLHSRDSPDDEAGTRLLWQLALFVRASGQVQEALAFISRKVS